MSQRKRQIDYKPQFGGDIFRPPSEIEGELAELESEPSSIVRPNERTNGSTRGSSTDTSTPTKRAKTRHSFDVYRDQVASLHQIQVAMYQQNGTKPKLGDLVQEALDQFLERHGIERKE